MQRVLLLEDDLRLADFLRRGLEENGYQAQVETSGDGALSAAQREEFDAAILDLMVPGRDGLEVCGELRRRGFRKPILIVTARDSVEDKVTGLDRGADDYITKPFEFAELLARLRAALRRSSGDAATVTIGDLVIDSRAQRVYRGGKMIPLSGKEFAILSFLASRRGRPANRNDIAAAVWEMELEPQSSLIEVYINRLRGKIDEGHDVQLIQTRRGEGYVLAGADAVGG